MGPVGVLLTTVLGALAWPLLVVAAIEVGGLLGLATVLRAARTRHQPAPATPVAEPDAPAPELILAC